MRETTGDGRPQAERLLKSAGVHQRDGRAAAAEVLCRQALAVAPRHPGAHFVLGRVLLQQGRTKEALGALSKAARLAPRQAAILAALAEAQAASGAAAQAAATYRKVAALEPANPDTQAAVACALHAFGRMQESLAYYERALALRPGDGEMWNNLGRALQDVARLADAEAAFRRAHDLLPMSAVIIDNLGNALKEQDRLEEAEPLYRRAIELAPDFALAHFHLGNLLGLNGETEAALAHFDRAVALAPGLHEAAKLRGQYRMMKGDFEPGLVGYDARKRAPDKAIEERAYAAPAWDGAPLPEGRLLVWPEQGVGDHILYAALLPLARARVASCVVECDRRLAPMFARAMPGIDFVSSRAESDVSGFTHQLPLADLMRSLKPWPQGFAPPRRFLAPDPERLAAAQAWLDSLGPGPRVGLSWRSAVKRIGPSKSLSLERWRPILAERGAQFVNLQYGDTEADVAAAESAGGLKIEAMPGLDRFADLEGLAALIDGLDLVLTTSNVTAHVAGALGKPCWLLLAKTPMWYWGKGLRKDGVLFYPSLRPYWQSTFGRWDDVVESVAAAFGRWLATGGAG